MVEQSISKEIGITLFTSFGNRKEQTPRSIPSQPFKHEDFRCED
jgi:hypothetical protein